MPFTTFEALAEAWLNSRDPANFLHQLRLENTPHGFHQLKGRMEEYRRRKAQAKSQPATA